MFVFSYLNTNSPLHTNDFLVSSILIISAYDTRLKASVLLLNTNLSGVLVSSSKTKPKFCNIFIRKMPTLGCSTFINKMSLYFFNTINRTTYFTGRIQFIDLFIPVYIREFNIFKYIQ